MGKQLCVEDQDYAKTTYKNQSMFPLPGPHRTIILCNKLLSVIKLTIVGWDNDLAPGRHQVIISTSAGILLIWRLGTNLDKIWIKIFIYFFSLFKKMRLKMTGHWRPFLSWPQCVKRIQSNEIVSMTAQTVSYLCVTLNSCMSCQWHNQIYL